MDAASITGRIADWLQGVGGSDLKIEQVNSSSSQQYCPGQCLTRNRKRKFDSLMDETSLRNKSVIDSGINLPPSSIADLSNADFSQEDFEATASQTRSTSPSKRTRSESPSKRSRSASPSKRPKFQLKFSLPTINFKAEEDFSCIENLPLGNPLIAALFEAENQIPADLQVETRPLTARVMLTVRSHFFSRKRNGPWAISCRSRRKPSITGTRRNSNLSLAG